MLSIAIGLMLLFQIIIIGRGFKIFCAVIDLMKMMKELIELLQRILKFSENND